MSLDDKLLTGRPHGGLSIMRNKSLSNSIKTLQYDDSRIIGIEVQSNNNRINSLRQICTIRRVISLPKKYSLTILRYFF